MRKVNTPAKATSEKKWPPAAIRNRPTATPKTRAAPVATARQGAGATTAAATVQNAPEGSPATNEQFFGHGPRGSHQGTNVSGPPNSVTSIGRGRPQLSLR